MDTCCVQIPIRIYTFFSFFRYDLIVAVNFDLNLHHLIHFSFEYFANDIVAFNIIIYEIGM